MERTRVLLPGSSLTDENGPLYYEAKDLYVGGKIGVLSHSFVLLDADEYAYKYMEENPTTFKYSDTPLITTKILGLLRKLDQQARVQMIEKIQNVDIKNNGTISRKNIVAIAKDALEGSGLVEHEIITFCRQFENLDENQSVDYVKLIRSM